MIYQHSSNKIQGKFRGIQITSHLIQETYNRWSSVYDIFFKSWLEFGRRDAIEMLDLFPGQRVLEIGVGTGLSFEYYPLGLEVVGFDYSDGMLRQSCEKVKSCPQAEFELLQMDAQNMAFPDKKFDRILACYVMTVVPDPQKAILEILRVAKPGAKVVFINHLRSKNKVLSVLEDVFHPIFSEVGLFTLDKDLLTILSSCGITDFKIEPTSIFRLHYIISFTVPR